MVEKHQVVLLDNIYLPVYYGKIDRKEYYIKYFDYTEEEMKAKLSENFEKFISGLQEKGVQIVEKDVKIEKGNLQWRATADFLVIEKTGEAAPFKSEETDEEDERQD